MQKFPENWKDRRQNSAHRANGAKGAKKSIRIKVLRRSQNIPEDKVLDLLPKRKRFKNGKWVSPEKDLRLLALARNPKLQMTDIAAIMDLEFSPKQYLFDKGSCQSRLNFLRLLWARGAGG